MKFCGSSSPRASLPSYPDKALDDNAIPSSAVDETLGRKGTAGDTEVMPAEADELEAHCCDEPTLLLLAP